MKKLITILLIAALAFSITACGGSPADKDGEILGGDTVTETPEETPAASDETEAPDEVDTPKEEEPSPEESDNTEEDPGTYEEALPEDV